MKYSIVSIQHVQIYEMLRSLLGIFRWFNGSLRENPSYCRFKIWPYFSFRRRPISDSAVVLISVSSVGLLVVAPNDLKTNWILGWQHGNTDNGVSIQGYKISKVFSLRMSMFKENFSKYLSKWFWLWTIKNAFLL